MKCKNCKHWHKDKNSSNIEDEAAWGVCDIIEWGSYGSDSICTDFERTRETTYKCGRKPHWNVGDTLAYNAFYSDRESECVWGKVVKIEFDDEEKRCDWFYTFEDGIGVYEKLLLEEQTYKKKPSNMMMENKTCRTCANRERWQCGSKVIQYCRVRKSNRTFNKLQKIKVTNPACHLYKEIE